MNKKDIEPIKTENCIICDESIKSGSISFAVNDEFAVHCECIEEHCVATNCYGCKIGKYPNCVFLSMKQALMKNGGN